MYKKLNFKLLAVVVIVLLALVIFLDQRDAKKGQRSFRDQLVEFDTAYVTKLLIYPAVNGNNEIGIIKMHSSWFVEENGKQYPADINIINSMLTELSNLRAKRIAATEQSRWGEFEVTDTAGTRVKVLDNDDVISEIIIGKFDFNQQRRSITSYVRMAGEDEVYAVEGYLKMIFNSEVNNLRDKSVVRFDKNNVTSFTYRFENPEDSYNLDKPTGSWAVNGIIADSLEADKFLNELAGYMSTDFADGIQKEYLGPARQSLTIAGNMMDPIQINLYRQDSTTAFIHSSLNPDALFISENMESVLFPSASRFFPALDE